MSDQITTKNHKQLKHSRHEFEVEVSPTKMGEYFEVAYRRLAPSVEIKGFRSGQAPKLMTIQKLGQDRYFQTALDLALPDSYAAACRQLDLKPVSPPEISIQGYGEGAPFTYKVSVDVIPTVDPGNYAKLKVKAPKADTKVEFKEVNEVLERLRKQQAIVTPVDRAATKGDRVEIDYVGKVKNVKRDDLSSQHHPVMVGDGVLPKKLEESLIGKKKGDTFSVTDTVPARNAAPARSAATAAGWHSAAGGNKDSVEFEVVVHEVAEVKLPEVDTKFASKFGRKDAKDLKEAIEHQLQAEKENAARHQLEQKVLDELLKKVTLEVPQSLIEEELTRRLDSIKQQFGAMFSTFLTQQKKTEEDIKQELRPEAERSVRVGLTLGEIAKREGFGKDQTREEDDNAFQRRVVRRTINFLVASATGITNKE